MRVCIKIQVFQKDVYTILANVMVVEIILGQPVLRKFIVLKIVETSTLYIVDYNLLGVVTEVKAEVLRNYFSVWHLLWETLSV